MSTFTLSPVIGHRGACGHAPENTLASFQRAKELGVQWVEFDVMLTRDHIPIVIHDHSVRRTTSGRGRVGKLTYETITKLDAGSWYAEKFTGEHIPTFVEVIALLGKLHLNANVEIKPYPGCDELTAELVIDTIQRHWPTHLAKPLLSSFSDKSMKVAQTLAPDLPRGLCLWRWLRKWEQYADDLACVSVHVAKHQLTEQRVAAIKASGRLVLAYTVNEPEEARRLYMMGVDAVFSDFPDRIDSKPY